MSSGSLTKMKMRFWDMNKKVWDTVIVDVPGKPGAGPEDEYIKVLSSSVEPDGNGNFISDEYNDDELDAVHAFASARLTVALWEKAIGKKIIWNWNPSDLQFNFRPLNLVLNDPEEGACFHLEDENVYLGHYNDIPTWRSADIISHEVTHALFEAVRPDIHYINTLYSKAVVEAIGDITPMLLHSTVLPFLMKANEFVEVDFKKPNLFSEFAEGFEKEGTGIRSVFITNIEKETPYTLGAVLVKTVYTLLAKSWEKSPSGIVGLLARAEELARLALCPLLDLREISPNEYLAHFRNYPRV